MLKDKKTPEIRFKGFTEDWEQRKFGNCVTIQRGGSPRPIENFITSDDKIGINWVKIGDVKPGERYIYKTNEKIIPEGVKHSREVFKGDLILSNSMSFGRPYIMGTNGCIHDGWLLIRDDKNLFDKEYLLQVLSSNYMLNQYKKLASGGVVNNLNSELVQNTIILLPKKEEQIKLGNVFQQIDNLITLHQRKCDKLLNFKKSMLEKMFPKNSSNFPEIRFKGFTDAWEQRKWIDMVNISTEMVDPKSGKYDNLPHIGPGNIESFTGQFYDNIKKVGEENLISGKFHFYPEDIIYGKINPQLGKYVFPLFEGLSSADSYVLNAKNGLNQKYLYTLLQTTDFYKYSVSVSMRSGMPKINRDELNAYEFSMPKGNEQQQIGALFLEIDNLITLHQLKEMKRS